MTGKKITSDIVLTYVPDEGGELTAWTHEIGIIRRAGKIVEVFSEDARSVRKGLFQRGEVQTLKAYTWPFQVVLWLQHPEDDPSESDEGVALREPVLTGDGEPVTAKIGITFSVIQGKVDLLLRLLRNSHAITKDGVAEEIKRELLGKVLALDLHKYTASELRGNEDLLRNIHASLERELTSTLFGFGLQLTNSYVNWGLTAVERERIREQRHQAKIRDIKRGQERREVQERGPVPQPIPRPRTRPGNEHKPLPESKTPQPNGCDVVIFKNDDTGYRNWFREHPRGYILNANSDMRTTSDMRLHRANCWSLEPERYRTLTVAWYKVCSTDKAAIQQWVQQKYRMLPSGCGICRP